MGPKDVMAAAQAHNLAARAGMDSAKLGAEILDEASTLTPDGQKLFFSRLNATSRAATGLNLPTNADGTVDVSNLQPIQRAAPSTAATDPEKAKTQALQTELSRRLTNAAEDKLTQGGKLENAQRIAQIQQYFGIGDGSKTAPGLITAPLSPAQAASIANQNAHLGIDRSRLAVEQSRAAQAGASNAPDPLGDLSTIYAKIGNVNKQLQAIANGQGGGLAQMQTRALQQQLGVLNAQESAIRSANPHIGAGIDSAVNPEAVLPPLRPSGGLDAPTAGGNVQIEPGSDWKSLPRQVQNALGAVQSAGYSYRLAVPQTQDEPGVTRVYVAGNGEDNSRFLTADIEKQVLENLRKNGARHAAWSPADDAYVAEFNNNPGPFKSKAAGAPTAAPPPTGVRTTTLPDGRVYQIRLKGGN